VSALVAIAIPSCPSMPPGDAGESVARRGFLWPPAAGRMGRKRSESQTDVYATMRNAAEAASALHSTYVGSPVLWRSQSRNVQPSSLPASGKQLVNHAPCRASWRREPRPKASPTGERSYSPMALITTAGSLPERVSVARIPDIRPMPSLIQVQIDSFEWFKREGLKELFAQISPIHA